jgi:hypothetical protein
MFMSVDLPEPDCPRLLHHSSIINIRGQSYRLKEKRQSGLFQGTDVIQESVTASA